MNKSYPLLSPQLGLFMAETADEQNSDYNIDLIYHLDDDVDVSRLRHALSCVLEKHPYILSTLVRTDDGELRILPPESGMDIRALIRDYADADELRTALTARFELLGGHLCRFGFCKEDGRNVFGFSVHHIVFDGLSFSNFRKELSAAYDAAASSDAVIEPEELDCFALAVMEESAKDGAGYSEAASWFEARLGAAAEIESLPLPDVYDNGSASGMRKKIVELPVDPEEAAAFCKRNGIGLSIPFTAAFGYALANFTAETGALFATIWHGRYDKRSLRSFGMMVRTHPVFTDFPEGDANIQTILARLSEQIKGARKRAVYPYGEVCRALSINPRVCFAFQGALYDYDIILEGRRQKTEDLRVCRPGYEILANLFLDKDGRYKCMFQYNGGSYSEQFIDNLGHSFAVAVRGFLTCGKLSDIELCDEGQLSELESYRGGSFKYSPSGDTVVSLFRKAAARNPDDCAVIFKDKRLSYKELDDITDRIASGIGGKVVSILIHRSENIPVCALAALKANAAYQPLDPSYPAERLNFMVKDSGADLLIVDRDLRGLVSEYDGEVLFTDEMYALDSGMDIHEGGGSPDNPFVILYTSGSTGTPKGVTLTHSNLVAFCSWYGRFYELKPSDCVAAYASFGFDACMMDLYPALTTGAAVCIVPEEIRLDLDALYAYFADNKVTHCFLTTQVGYQFATLFRTHPTLRHLSTGGEKLASLEPPENYRLYNAYGPTECTIFSTIYPIRHNERNIPIGKPLDSVTCLILNRFGKRLPAGAAGELVISGPQVSQGYLNRPDRTAGSFGVYGEQSYRSGDIVRYRTDGNIEFVGRKDGQVKIRGFRIELKEVEAVIREFGGIRDVTVQAFDKKGGGKFIAAYTVSDGKVDIVALRAFISANKPAYMVPESIMQVDSIPLNVNQKVDRKKLPEPQLASETQSSCPQRGPNALESLLLDMMTDILGSGRPGLYDPLIECGLSSILAMRLSAQLYKRFNAKIGSPELLSGLSTIDVADRVVEALLSDGRSKENEAPQAASIRSGVSELSFAQQGVYMHCVTNPCSVLYNIPVEMHFPASVSAEALRDAVQTVIAAHPVLAARFREDEEGGTVQTVPDTFEVSVPVVAGSSLEEEKRNFVRPFNLETDTLWRAEVIPGGDGPALLLDIHHIVCDGSSYQIIIRELIGILDDGDKPAEINTYLDFCRDQKAYAASPAMAVHKDYFASMFKEFERSSCIASDIDVKGLGKLGEVAVPIPSGPLSSPKEGFTDAGFWLAATAYAVARFTSSDDVYMATVSSGRSDVRYADTVGMFVNTIPVCAHLREQSSGAFIKEVADCLRTAAEHENYPFAAITSQFGFRPDILYACQLGVVSNNSLGGGTVSFRTFGLTMPKFKLCVLLDERAGRPSLVLQYNDALYSRELMQTLAQSILTAAGNMVADYDAPVRKVSMLGEDARRILEPFRSTAPSVHAADTFHEGISRWAVLTPDATAVMASDRTLTYAEYVAEADRMAQALSRRGVGRGDRIVLLLPRNSDFLVAVLAVMKCGAAFIPMDPAYPSDRISYILSDSDGRFIVTTSDKCGSYPGRAIDVEVLKDEASACPADAPEIEIGPDDIAYMIYTSGSTGTPKGVMLQHRGISGYLTPHPANPHTYAVAAGTDCVLCSATVSFDLSILEYGTALFNGKRLVFADEDTVSDSLALSRLYKSTGADVLSGTPSRIEAYMEIDEYVDVIRSCRVIQMGGEKLPQSLLKRLHELTDARIFNMYGPTEITICCNAAELSPGDSVTVGKPLPGFTEYIVDKDGNELPARVTGELLISGTGVCPGYWRLPEKTAAAFIEWNGTRAYKSGDLAAWTGSGDIAVYGRTDHQVKLNGLRIELGEIESVMSVQPGVRQCAVVVTKVGRQDKLVAYYTVDNECDIKAVKAAMAAQLTHYMVPDIFMCLDEMPVSPSGKADLRRLPAPNFEAAEYTAPRSEVEKFFCNAIAATLDLPRVGIKDDFFELGGTSLVAMRLSVLISRGGYKLAYRDIFDYPTAEKMAAFVSGGVAAEASESDFDVTDYDYTALDGIVMGNTLPTFLADAGQHRLGNVLLTGATGFLGMHVLRELLSSESVDSVWCFVRNGRGISGEERLRTLQFYYFEDLFQKAGERLHVISGDVTKPLPEIGVHIDTLVNCAANVKHFAAGTEIEDTNIKGARNCIEFCLKNGARLIHTSTASIGGISLTDAGAPHFLREDELYFGQEMDNKYIYSKFIAERDVLEAIAQRGLKAKIMRLGNLSPRSSDGEFQINFRSNSYVRRLKAYKTLGAVPLDVLSSQTEFSPIDQTAAAIVLLAGTNDNCVIFNVVNSHRELMLDVVDTMNRLWPGMELVSSEEFRMRLQAALNDPATAELMQPLLAYTSRSDGRKATFNKYTSDYTTAVLAMLGFRWSATTEDYMDKFLRAIGSLGFFDFQ